MILPFPINFNQNEWFIVVSVLVFVLVCIALPRRFPLVITLLVMIFNTELSLIADHMIAATLPFEMYDYNDTPLLDLFDEIMHFSIYPLSGYLMMYWYDVWISLGFKRVLFVLLAAIVSVCYEWLSVEAHVFTYKGWHLIYSFGCYLIILYGNIYFMHRIRTWLARYKK